MGILFGWLSMPEGTDQESWVNFLDSFTIIFLVLLAATCAVVVLGYRYAANKWRIRSHNDVFRTFGPLKWLLATIGGALVVAIACGVTYSKTLNISNGLVTTCLYTACSALLLGLLFSYLLIIFGPFTPQRYKYRAAPFLHRSK